MTELRQLFDDTFSMLNIVATPTQEEMAFKNASREYFSYVYPIFFIPTLDYELIVLDLGEEVVMGFEDRGNLMGRDMGDFKVMEAITLTDYKAFRVKPINTASFALEDSYVGSFQYVCEYILKKIERDNMRMLKSAGIDDGEGFEIEDISQVRDYLKKEFGVTAVGLVM